MDPSLTQDPERDAYPSQELVAELQVAGVPQIHPGGKEHGFKSLRVVEDAIHAGSPADTLPSPQREFVHIFFFNIKLPLCVAQRPRHLETETKEFAFKSPDFLLIASETPRF